MCGLGKHWTTNVCSVCTRFLCKSSSWKHGALRQVWAFVNWPFVAGMWQGVPGRALSRAVCKRGGASGQQSLGGRTGSQAHSPGFVVTLLLRTGRQ